VLTVLGVQSAIGYGVYAYFQYQYQYSNFNCHNSQLQSQQPPPAQQFQQPFESPSIREASSSLRRTTTTADSKSENNRIPNNDSDNNNNDGWHSIDVFYGDTQHLDLRPAPTHQNKAPSALQAWYSQAQQDQIVYELLGSKSHGYFVDLAANDARTLSNTFALERRFSWTGLCIEPNPRYWHDLAYRQCQVVAAVLGRERMEEIQFRMDNGVSGGIIDAKFDNKKEQSATKKEQNIVPKYTVTLLEVLQRYNTPKTIDYLSLDVEGAEDYIMGLFPFGDYKIKILTVERPTPALKDRLKEAGYKWVANLSLFGETLWVHISIQDQLAESPTLQAAMKMYGRGHRNYS